jgi:hypothetical protein
VSFSTAYIKAHGSNQYVILMHVMPPNYFYFSFRLILSLLPYIEILFKRLYR